MSRKRRSYRISTALCKRGEFRNVKKKNSNCGCKALSEVDLSKCTAEIEFLNASAKTQYSFDDEYTTVLLTKDSKLDQFFKECNYASIRYVD